MEHFIIFMIGGLAVFYQTGSITEWEWDPDISPGTDLNTGINQTGIEQYAAQMVYHGDLQDYIFDITRYPPILNGWFRIGSVDQKSRRIIQDGDSPSELCRSNC
jgi:hypothetical protein